MANNKMETFVISRQDLRRLLLAFGVGEKNLEMLLSSMEKTHRHITAVAFASLLEKAGLERDRVANVLRRMGLDDITVREVLDTADEQRILSETGRLFEATIELS